MINRFSPHLVSYPLLNQLNYQIKTGLVKPLMRHHGFHSFN